MRLRSLTALLLLPAALLAGACADDDAGGEATATETTEAAGASEAPETTESTTTTVAGPERPTTSLVPTTPEWAAACATGDKLIDEAWQLQEGTLSDKTVVAVSMLTMINELPPGAAEAQKAEILALINAFLGGGDVEQYKANFRPTAESLLGEVAQGCGAEAGSLPLPPDVITEIYDFLYPNG